MRTSLDLAVDPSDLGTSAGNLWRKAISAQSKAQSLKRAKKANRGPLRFQSSDGLEILVGRNNRQNEYVTFRAASPDDIWLHVKDMPGSHVIIRTLGAEPPENTLQGGRPVSRLL